MAKAGKSHAEGEPHELGTQEQGAQEHSMPERDPPEPEARIPLVRVTRRLHFSAAHRLYNRSWSDAQNRETFGDCSNPEWHGHNYELLITVEGPVDPDTGYVADLKRIKDLTQERVIEDVDHANLNTQVSWLEGINPTTENLAVAIWHRIEPGLPENASLVSIIVQETPRNSAEYRGEVDLPKRPRS